MAFKEGQFDVVEPIEGFYYQFECSMMSEWNDSFYKLLQNKVQSLGA